ncbi:hypothetical protein [Paenibacillus aceti]|uniref:hypothetical protein n=1 Tax=Paenibacillus aceti TaxID=1820010 RepID=UPI000EA17260|nr:hypothetical protein [Paenibacillus aceti]
MSTKVDGALVEGKSLKSEAENIRSSILSNNIEYEDATYEILENETHIYRELQNIETGDVIPQYQTVMVVASDPYSYSGSTQSSDKTVKVTITLYYHSVSQNSYNYIGLDKVYWRWDKGSNWTSDILPNGINSAKMVQIGPGINSKAQNQSKDVSPIGGDHYFGTTYMGLAPSKWVEVLDGGLATEMGLNLHSTYWNQATSKVFAFDWSLSIKGVQWP